MAKAASATATATTMAASAAVTAVSSHANSTFHFTLPSADDLFYLPSRVFAKSGRLLFGLLESLPALGLGGAEPAVRAVPDAVAQPAAGALTGWHRAMSETLQLSNISSYWGLFHYVLSRWAIATFSIALILNRVKVYASTRQRILLRWDKRFALRLVPILLLITQIHRILQALRCQSWSGFPQYRYGRIDRYSPLDWPSQSGFLYWLTSNGLFLSSDSQSCAAIGMSRIDGALNRDGSFALLWPTFLRLSLSHFVETLSTALEQGPIMTDVGMSVFEHSLAFAETEAMLSQLFGLGIFSAGKSKAAGQTTTSAATTPSIILPGTITTRAVNDATNALLGPHRLDRINVPVEVLVIALLSCCNALSANIIAIFNKQHSLRLINTSMWGIGFLSAFVWGFLNNGSTFLRSSSGTSWAVPVRNATAISSATTMSNGTLAATDARFVSGLLNFPTVCIVGFLPHLVIVLGIAVCSFIYLLALTLSAVSLESNPCLPHAASIKDRFRLAHQNLQVAVQFRGIEIKWHEDFYTALLRVGFAALTAASEAVFLNEGRAVEVRQFTWLEEDRLDELEATGNRNLAAPFQITEDYGLPARRTPSMQWESGYAKERKQDRNGEEQAQQADETSVIVFPQPAPDGVGAVQRTARFYLLCIFLRGIYYLLGGWLIYGVGIALDSIGITGRPPWLRRVVGKSLRKDAEEKVRIETTTSTRLEAAPLDFLVMSHDGRLAVPATEDIDIEPEMRQRLLTHSIEGTSEETIDQELYTWWKQGGWWGTRDESGEYQPSLSQDWEDSTSMVSKSSMNDYDDGQDWQSESEGRQTPTQWSFASIPASRDSTPAVDNPLDASTLSRLLSQQDDSSKDEARVLASHLQLDSRIMTRSRYQRKVEAARSQVLLVGRTFPQTGSKQPLTAAEESEILESLILTRRKGRVAQSQSNSESGPACVVCQSQTRTIIAWPCRCLCVCEDCRLSLAMNNFKNCVTCRREVSGFVRLWMP